MARRREVRHVPVGRGVRCFAVHRSAPARCPGRGFEADGGHQDAIGAAALRRCGAAALRRRRRELRTNPKAGVGDARIAQAPAAPSSSRGRLRTWDSSPVAPWPKASQGRSWSPCQPWCLGFRCRVVPGLGRRPTRKSNAQAKGFRRTGLERCPSATVPQPRYDCLPCCALSGMAVGCRQRWYDPRTDRWTQEDPLNSPLDYEQAIGMCVPVTALVTLRIPRGLFRRTMCPVLCRSFGSNPTLQGVVSAI
jgi:hypothetical protein